MKDEDMKDDDYEYTESNELPDGWLIAVWPDGRAMVCSPRTCPRELGGYAAAKRNTEAAIASVRDLLESLDCNECEAWDEENEG